MADTIILFDLETSGLDMRKHEIVQIAAAAYSIGTNSILDEMEVKVQFDEAKADPKALEVNGYKREVWQQQAMGLQDALDDFSDFIAPHKQVRMYSEAKRKEYFVAQGAGFNAVRFDHPWLVEKYRASGRFMAMSLKCLDVMQLGAWAVRLQGVALADDKQETICRHFGIEYNAHDALEDVRAMAKLIGKIAGRKEA